MERQILFRGKQVDTGEWLQGFLSQSRNIKEKPAILKPCIDYEEKGVMMFGIVDPKTVGQFTGLTDKNGKRIFEGDIVEVIGEDYLAIIVWDEDTARFELNFFDEEVVSDFDSYWGMNVRLSATFTTTPSFLNDRRHTYEKTQRNNIPADVGCGLYDSGKP